MQKHDLNNTTLKFNSNDANSNYVTIKLIKNGKSVHFLLPALSRIRVGLLKCFLFLN